MAEEAMDKLSISEYESNNHVGYKDFHEFN